MLCTKNDMQSKRVLTQAFYLLSIANVNRYLRLISVSLPVDMSQSKWRYLSFKMNSRPSTTKRGLFIWIYVNYDGIQLFLSVFLFGLSIGIKVLRTKKKLKVLFTTIYKTLTHLSYVTCETYVMQVINWKFAIKIYFIDSIHRRFIWDSSKIVPSVSSTSI